MSNHSNSQPARVKDNGQLDHAKDWVPFPLNSLPEKLREFVKMQAEAIGCDPALVAMPALVACSGAIGMTRSQLVVVRRRRKRKPT